MRKENTRKALDAAALAAVLHYCAFRFLQNSTFPFAFTDLYKWITIFLMAGTGGIRFLWIAAPEWKAAGRAERKGWLLKRGLCFAAAVPFFLAAFKHDYKILIFIPLGVLCLYRQEARRVLRGFTGVISVLLAAMALCALSGSIDNIALPYVAARSYGAINTSDFAAYFTFLLLFVWCAQKRRTFATGLYLIAAELLITALAYYLAESKTGLLCGGITAALILWDLIRERIRPEGKKAGKLLRAADAVTAGFFPLMGIGTAVMIAGYGAGASWALRMDGALSGRLGLAWTIFRRHGVKLLGNTTLWENDPAYYDFMDISYEMLAVRYGILVALIVTAFWVWMAVRALRSGERRIALAMVLVALHAFPESHFLDLNYNIFLLMPLCTFSGTPAEQPDAKRWAASRAAAWIMAGAAALLLPRFLSWTRTVFFLQGWIPDSGAGGALAASLAWVLVCFGCWKALPAALFRRKALIPLGLCAALMAGMVLAANGRIERGLEERKAQLDQEEQIILRIQEATDQPVYATEMAELYRRRFGGFTDYVFPAHEMTVAKRGTVVLDREDRQYFRRIALPISETSLVHTFDPAVEEAVRRETAETETE